MTGRIFCWVVVLGACVDEPLPSLTGLSSNTPGPGASPEVELFEMPNTSYGYTVITGLVSDPDEPFATLKVELSSSLDGELLYTNPGDAGAVFWSGDLSPGLHTLTLTVTDAWANITSATGEITVIGDNIDPTCLIITPQDGQVFSASNSIEFAASVSDANGDELQTLWFSDLYGSMVLGEGPFDFILGPPGEHEISIEVTDERGGVCTDSVFINLVP
jgi:hypothetical protein